MVDGHKRWVIEMIIKEITRVKMLAVGGVQLDILRDILFPNCSVTNESEKNFRIKIFEIVGKLVKIWANNHKCACVLFKRLDEFPPPVLQWWWEMQTSLNWLTVLEGTKSFFQILFTYLSSWTSCTVLLPLCVLLAEPVYSWFLW